MASPRTVPQLRNGRGGARRLRPLARAEFATLIPHSKGAGRATAAGVNAMVVFFAPVLESHGAENANHQIADSLAGFGDIAAVAAGTGILVHGIIAVAFGGPFEGSLPVDRVVAIASAMRDFGVDRAEAPRAWSPPPASAGSVSPGEGCT